MSEPLNPDQYTTPFKVVPTARRQPYPAILPTTSANSPKGKVIIITGGGSGIGAAAARVWAQAGAEGVVIAGRRLDKLNEVAKELEAINPSTKALAISTDIVSEEDVKNLFLKVQEAFGRPADVLLNNAGYAQDDQLIGDTPASQWWPSFEINLKGGYNMTHHFIQSQPDPKKPTGTIITVSSGRAGFTFAGGSAYNIAKLAEQRLNEHLQLEYPDLRVFTTMPGIAKTAMSDTLPYWGPYAKDHVDLTGMLALYLVQPRADYLKGCMVSVNWDVDELEAHKEEIVKDGVLKAGWMPVLPINGGKGLGGLL